MKNSSLKYNLSVLCYFLGVLLFISGIFIAGYDILTHGTLSLKSIFGMIMIAIGIITWRTAEKRRIMARQAMEVDEYGNSRKTYQSLSKSERHAIDLATIRENEQALSDTEFKTMLKKGSDNPDVDLENIIGLDDVKIKLLELKVQMEYLGQGNTNAFHMCFLGNPGTGKTTMASIFTGYLFVNHYLKKNEYIYTDAASIMSSADPVKRLQLILQKAHGRVLFLDEAYSFIYDNSGIGSKLIALLLNTMENNRNDMTFILAGYKNEMREMINMNPGLKSRINTYLFFHDYSLIELRDIAEHFVAMKKMEISEEALAEVMQIVEDERDTDNFANARSVRKVIDEAVSRHYLNLKMGITETEKIIQPQDIVCNQEEREFFNF